MSNEYQEALDRISYNFGECEIGSNYYDRQLPQDLKFLQQLVDKEAPMKPKTKKYGKGSEWVCPNCKSHIAYFDELGIGTVPAIKYCRECGQRINLGDD